MALTAERVLAVSATLGEGPVWVMRDDALWFVDIIGRRVHRFAPASGHHWSWNAPAKIGWVLPSAHGFLAGLATGVATFDPARGTFDNIRDPEPGLPGNRLNDATIDIAGRLWFGTMDDAESAPTGRLYVLENDRIRDSGLPPVTITNGPAFAADGRTLFHTDTLGRTIWAVPLNDDGSLGSPRIFAKIDPADGWPDGCTTDAEGGLWTGLWGGWHARRYDASGRVASEVRLPCANVTKVAFGGRDLRTGYITTARKGLDATALTEQPLAGDLFAFQSEVPGLPGALAAKTTIMGGSQ